jgi:hypothetical protein
LRRFLAAWRKKKGFGSIPDEVFRTVDASLLLVLLELDQDTPAGQTGKPGSVRKELYDLVDHGVDCFDRAVDLLETYRRLFVLSRLYQHRKMAPDVLATWKRIIDGEDDRGGELGDGEQRVRSYLSNVSNQALVYEYGLWLAGRNPKLGVQVFTDEKGKAPRFEHNQIVAVLREEAPDAVKYYLEHLVFGKGNTAYVNELITYYLDIVITDLETSSASRDNVAASYDTYRALSPPKPTFLRFLADNAPSDDEAWQSRLRLLQLLGGGHNYDVAAIRQRIDSLSAAVRPLPFPKVNGDSTDGDVPASTKTSPQREQHLLVPESIILAARARDHESALRLLVHHLGDYDTAVAYCLRGAAALTPSTTNTSSPSFQHYQHHHRKSSNQPDNDDDYTLPPTFAQQCTFFNLLLRELLALRDADERTQHTSALLERFGGWFDALAVLELLPPDWSVAAAGGFLARALRRLEAEAREARVERALSGAENLRVGVEFYGRVMGRQG